ncbi:MAG: hypothetical protein CL398_09835 [Acidiferrobacteraceae bacterium]|nr:hypothetical protein [Acidiferrobacteraceae bacterium]
MQDDLINQAVFTDLDGTLLDATDTLPSKNREALHFLGEKKILRVVVTGRSLVSAKRVLDFHFPIDVLATSTGGEIFKFPNHLLHSIVMSPEHVRRAAKLLKSLNLDFMVHSTISQERYIKWSRNTTQNRDFEERLRIYSQYQEPLSDDLDKLNAATQLLVICPNDHGGYIKKLLEKRLFEYNIIRTTSPLDHHSIWYEIMPKEVSKSRAAIWICQHHGIAREKTLAIGNDFNDLDLLRWSNSSYVVGNSPSELRHEFSVVASNTNNGFADAVYKWARANPD